MNDYDILEESMRKLNATNWEAVASESEESGSITRILGFITIIALVILLVLQTLSLSFHIVNVVYKIAEAEVDYQNQKVINENKYP